VHPLRHRCAAGCRGEAARPRPHPAEDGNKFVARGDDAIRFWTEGLATLPDDWDLYVPDDLVEVQVRDEALSANVRVGSGVDCCPCA